MDHGDVATLRAEWEGIWRKLNSYNGMLEKYEQALAGTLSFNWSVDDIKKDKLALEKEITELMTSSTSIIQTLNLQPYDYKTNPNPHHERAR